MHTHRPYGPWIWISPRIHLMYHCILPVLYLPDLVLSYPNLIVLLPIQSESKVSSRSSAKRVGAASGSGGFPHLSFLFKKQGGEVFNPRPQIEQGPTNNQLASTRGKAKY
jgi:hypothetical protein